MREEPLLDRLRRGYETGPDAAGRRRVLDAVRNMVSGRRPIAPEADPLNVPARFVESHKSSPKTLLYEEPGLIVPLEDFAEWMVCNRASSALWFQFRLVRGQRDERLRAQIQEYVGRRNMTGLVYVTVHRTKECGAMEYRDVTVHLDPDIVDMLEERLLMDWVDLGRKYTERSTCVAEACETDTEEPFHGLTKAAGRECDSCG